MSVLGFIAGRLICHDPIYAYYVCIFTPHVSGGCNILAFSVFVSVCVSVLLTILTKQTDSDSGVGTAHLWLSHPALTTELGLHPLARQKSLV